MSTLCGRMETFRCQIPSGGFIHTTLLVLQSTTPPAKRGASCVMRHLRSRPSSAMSRRRNWCTVRVGTALVADGKPFGWWLYDEFDVVREGQITTLAHSILLTGGVELRVLFFGSCLRPSLVTRIPTPVRSTRACDSHGLPLRSPAMPAPGPRDAARSRARRWPA